MRKSAYVVNLSPNIRRQNPCIHDPSTINSHSQHDLKIAVFPAARSGALEDVQRCFVRDELARGFGAELAQPANEITTRFPSRSMTRVMSA